MGTDSHSAQLAHKPNVAQSPREHTQHIHTRSLSDKHTDSRWFSQLISSTHRPPPRPASTNSGRSSQRHAPFMDVKCPGCFTITTVFSHAQTVVVCQGCSQVLCQPTGGKARLTEGCSFRRK